MSSVAFCTLGCKVNQYETDAMEELFSSKGYEIRTFDEAADIYIINTCTVTHMADRKSRQMLHRARKKNPGGVVVAVGCYVQAAKEHLQADAQIDLIVGNNNKSHIVELIEAFLGERSGDAGDKTDYSAVMDINHTREYESLHISKVSEHTRAYIKIQDGCNQFCSYCIIPYARGRVRSRQEADIVDEVCRLVDNGYKEIVLTGIHISSYGLDFEGAEYNNSMKGEQLIHLIEVLGRIKRLGRIRLGSLEPRIITHDFVRRLSAIKQVCPQFHLSLQSGCDATLERMNRKYTTLEYEQSCDLLRKHFKLPAITTDVIVGFPGETNEEFEITARFLEKIAFAQMHIFKYSKREGTKAATMDKQVDEQIKNERSTRLLELDACLREKFIGQWQGMPVEVLLEEAAQLDGQAYMIGHTKEYIHAAVQAEENKVNTIFKGRISLKSSEDFVICERID